MTRENYTKYIFCMFCKLSIQYKSMQWKYTIRAWYEITRYQKFNNICDKIAIFSTQSHTVRVYIIASL